MRLQRKELTADGFVKPRLDVKAFSKWNADETFKFHAGFFQQRLFDLQPEAIFMSKKSQGLVSSQDSKEPDPYDDDDHDSDNEMVTSGRRACEDEIHEFVEEVNENFRRGRSILDMLRSSVHVV